MSTRTKTITIGKTKVRIVVTETAHDPDGFDSQYEVTGTLSQGSNQVKFQTADELAELSRVISRYV